MYTFFQGIAAQFKAEQKGLQIWHNEGLLQARKIRRIRQDHEVRSWEFT